VNISVPCILPVPVHSQPMAVFSDTWPVSVSSSLHGKACWCQ